MQGLSLLTRATGPVHTAAVAVFIAVCALWFAPLRPALAAEGPYYVKGTKVNLREAPGGAVQQQLEDGAKLFIIERDGEWCHVSLPALSRKGWMHRDFLREDSGRAARLTPSTEADPGATEVMLAADQCVNPAGGQEAKPKQATRSGSSIQFKADAKLTSPAKLGSAEYQSVGGPGLASISATNVNLRAKPSLSAEVVGKADNGDRAYVVTNNDPWYLVSIPERNLKGWVFGEYMDLLPRVEIKADDVRLRETPGLDGRVKEQLQRGDVFYKLEAKDGWVNVASSASGLNGWVKAEYVVRSEGSVSRPYRVTGDQVNFRAAPAVDADVIARLPGNATVNVLGRNEKWAYVYFEGHKGWMYTDYIVPMDGSSGSSGTVQTAGYSRPERRTLSWKQVGGKSIGDRLIQRAEAMKGTPYVWGGESDSGVDCSGLIYKLLCDEGVQAKCLPRRASEQMLGLGLAVDKEELEPGDLVFFTTYKAGPSHVGIYLGDGDFIHASSAQRRVTVSNMSEGYYRERFVGARRITEEQILSMK